MLNLNQKPFFFAPALSYHNGSQGRGSQAGQPVGRAAHEFASVLEETVVKAVEAPAPVSHVYPAHLANTAYWSHPSYAQAMSKAC